MNSGKSTRRLKSRHVSELAATLVLVALWAVTFLEFESVYVPILIFTVVSGLYGFFVKRWWAPLVPLASLPVLAAPQAYQDNLPDYSNGIAVALVVMPVGCMSVALGVLMAKLTLRRRARRLSARDTPLPHDPPRSAPD